MCWSSEALQLSIGSMALIDPMSDMDRVYYFWVSPEDGSEESLANGSLTVKHSSIYWFDLRFL